jgi:nucleoid DNA-binding protein
MTTKKKKATAKKKTTTTSKSSASKRPTAIKNKLTKSQILENIANNTGLSRKQVGAVIEEMSCLMGRSIMKNAAGEFIVPGSFKVVTINKPARKARKGINPFTGEPTMFKAKPASVAVKIRPLKGLKEYANS